MQPPSLKGGGRVQVTSCYDPNRATQEDYSNIPMPSSALVAIQEGDLLEEGETGKSRKPGKTL